MPRNGHHGVGNDGRRGVEKGSVLAALGLADGVEDLCPHDRQQVRGHRHADDVDDHDELPCNARAVEHWRNDRDKDCNDGSDDVGVLACRYLVVDEQQQEADDEEEGAEDGKA